MADISYAAAQLEAWSSQVADLKEEVEELNAERKNISKMPLGYDRWDDHNENAITRLEISKEVMGLKEKLARVSNNAPDQAKARLEDIQRKLAEVEDLLRETQPSSGS